MSEKVKILGIPFDKTTLNLAAEQAINWLKEDKKRFIATPNPEMLLESLKNKDFHSLLNKTDLNIADGIGILWASKFINDVENLKNKKSKIKKSSKWLKSLALIPFSKKRLKTILPERVTGVDLMEKICEKAAKINRKIFLLGADNGIAEKVKEILEKKYPGTKIVGTFAGSPKKEDENEIMKKINRTSPEILFVAFGAPKQELWILENLKKFPSVKLAIGVGGAFDFISKKRKRAPVFMQKIGLEWLFRLLQEPSRIKRIYNATIKFPITVLKKSL